MRRALLLISLASCATDEALIAPQPEPRLRLQNVDFNAAPVARTGCIDNADCPNETPFCIDGGGFSNSGCGGARVMPCDPCGLFEQPAPGAPCGACACTLDCRIPFTSYADQKCDWGSGLWRAPTCREGGWCASNEVCSEDGRCVVAICDSDLDCARGDTCSGGRCHQYRPRACVERIPEPPP